MGEVVNFISVRACLMPFMDLGHFIMHRIASQHTKQLTRICGAWSVQCFRSSPHGELMIMVLTQMLEFCETVNPNLSDYESDGVRSSISSISCGVEAVPLGLAHPPRQFCHLENGAIDKCSLILVNALLLFFLSNQLVSGGLIAEYIVWISFPPILFIMFYYPSGAFVNRFVDTDLHMPLTIPSYHVKGDHPLTQKTQNEGLNYVGKEEISLLAKSWICSNPESQI